MVLEINNPGRGQISLVWVTESGQGVGFSQSSLGTLGLQMRIK